MHIPQNRQIDAMLERLAPVPEDRDPEHDLKATAAISHEHGLEPGRLAHRLHIEGSEAWQYACRLLSEAPAYTAVALDVLAQSRTAYLVSPPDGS